MQFRYSFRWLLVLIAVAAVLIAIFTEPHSPTDIPDGLFVQPGKAGKPLVPFVRKKMFGYLDERGRVAIPPIYSWADRFQGGYALCSRNGKAAVIDESGLVVGAVPTIADSYFRAGVDRIWFQVGRKWGLADLRGNVLVEPIYDDVDRFSGSLARVNVGAKLEFPGFMEGGKSGYVDLNGKEVIPPTFSEWAWGFHEGFAVVGDQLIDRDGNEKFTRRGLGISLSDGLLPVYWYEGTTDYVDVEGSTVFTVNGSGDEFSEGLARVRFQRKVMYIDTSGAKVISCDEATKGREFHNGMAAIQIGEEHWGFIDRTGKLVTPTHFNDVKPAEEKFLIVHYGGRLVDVMDAPSFWEGGRWIMTDRVGRPLAVVRVDQDTN